MCACVCGGLSVSPNASQGDLAFLLQGFPFNSFWDWNYDEVIFLQKLPMSLVVSLGKFLKCIFNLTLSLCPLLSISHLSLLGFLSLSPSSHLTCQCVNVTLRQGNIRETIWRMIEKKKEQPLYFAPAQQPVFEVVTYVYIFILFLFCFF